MLHSAEFWAVSSIGTTTSEAMPQLLGVSLEIFTKPSIPHVVAQEFFIYYFMRKYKMNKKNIFLTII